MRLFGGLVLALVALSCGSSAAVGHPPPTPSPSGAAATPLASATSTPAPTVSTAASRYGPILVDGSGRTLYLFDAEAGPQPRCYGACAQAWPPLLADAQPQAGPGLASALLGMVARSDGSKQVVYNGHPLYRYAGDRAPGDILCQAAFEYGGGWFVVDPAGDRISTP